MNYIRIAFLLLSLTTQAHARGGGCGSAACNFTAMLVLAALAVLFIGSVYKSVRVRGLFMGIITNRAAQLVLGYLGMLLAVVGGSIAAEKLWGRDAAMWLLVGLIAILVLGPRALQRLRAGTT